MVHLCLTLIQKTHRQNLACYLGKLKKTIYCS